MDELHEVDHIYIHNFLVFSVRLNSRRYEILEAQDSTDTAAPLDLQWKVSLFLHSTYHYWALKMQAIHIGSYPGQRAVYLMPVINIGPWEMWDTAKLHRIMSIAIYDCSLWWRAMTTNKNKSEPNMSLCQDLVDFIPFVSFLEVVDHIMAG